MEKQYCCKISKDYLYREELKGNDVESWIVSYCKRNNVNISDDNNYYIINFSSLKRLQCFQSQGNKNFPYFEFI